MHRTRLKTLCLVLLAAALSAGSAAAQFLPGGAPNTLAPPTQPPAGVGSFTTPGSLSPAFGGGAPAPATPLPTTPPGGFSPLPASPPAGAAPGGAALGVPTFDPYANAAGVRPSIFGPSAAPAYTTPGVAPAAPAAGPTPLFGGIGRPGGLFGPPAPAAGYPNPYAAAAPYAGQPVGQPYITPLYPGSTPVYGGTTPYAGSPYAGQPYAGSPYPAAPYAPGAAGGVPGAPGTAPYYNPQPLVNPIPGGYYAAPYSGAPYGGTPYGASTGPLGGLFGGGTGAAAAGPPYERLFQNTGARYTWLHGSGGSNLEVNEVDLFTTMVWNNFIFTQYPLRVTPEFIVDFLEGPTPPYVSDMPGAVYSALGEVYWAPQLFPNFGLELAAWPGVYTDFRTFTSRSFRVPAMALGVLQISPTVTGKLGVKWINRNHLKLLPTGGVLWQPDQQTRLDISFPSPKLSHYLTTLGNWEVWGYVGGEYGGGAWTIDNVGTSDRVDYNDIRAFGGLEWTNPGGLKGFFEAGYVFKRELFYVVVPTDSVTLTDTFMLRGGLAF